MSASLMTARLLPCTGSQAWDMSGVRHQKKSCLARCQNHVQCRHTSQMLRTMRLASNSILKGDHNCQQVAPVRQGWGPKAKILLSPEWQNLIRSRDTKQ